AAYAALTLLLLFAGIEGVLWLAGTKTLSQERDHALGFSGRTLFERDRGRGVFVTSPRAMRHSVNYQEFALEKPRNGLRVFTIRDSSGHRLAGRAHRSAAPPPPASPGAPRSPSPRCWGKRSPPRCRGGPWSR